MISPSRMKEMIEEEFENLEREIKRLKWYLNEIRNQELLELNIDIDEYETHYRCTDYSNIINLVEEALNEVPQEDCRYKLSEVTNE